MPGRVRAILAQHARAQPGGERTTAPAGAPDTTLDAADGEATRPDPNALLPADGLAQRLEAVRATRGDAAVRALAHAYVELWARTFRTLVRHLRGRPERALALFVEEVYPFLRGDRLAARLEQARPGSARLLVAAGLPGPYVAGLAEGFVRLSGATASCLEAGATPAGIHLDVRYGVAPRDRAARAAQALAQLRIPLLACAGLAALVGIAIAGRFGDPEPWRVAAVLVGSVAVQAGANALHELRNPHPAGPLGPLRLGRRVQTAVAMAGYGIAGVLGAALALAQPLVLAFAAAGLVLSLLFGRFRNAGWGPLLAGATYPLMALGAAHAVLPSLAPALRPEVLLALPIGGAAAALLHLDDLADRPLDEAGGQRTLAVRLPGPQQAIVFAVLLGGAVALLLLDAWLWPTGDAVLLAACGAMLACSLGLGEAVRRRISDPARLAPARLATLLLALAIAAASVALAAGGAEGP